MRDYFLKGIFVWVNVSEQNISAKFISCCLMLNRNGNQAFQNLSTVAENFASPCLPLK